MLKVLSPPSSCLPSTIASLQTQDTLSALRSLRLQMEADRKLLGDAAQSVSEAALAAYRGQSIAGPGTPRSLLRVLQHQTGTPERTLPDS